MWLYNIEVKHYQRSFGRYNFFLIGDKKKTGRYVSCHCEFDEVDDSSYYSYDNTVKGYPKIIKLNHKSSDWIAKISSAGNQQRMTKEEGYNKGEVYISERQADYIDIAAYGYIYNGKPDIKDARYFEYLVIIYDIGRPIFIKVCPVGKPDYWLIFHKKSTDKIKADVLSNYTWDTKDGKPRKKKMVNLLDLYQPDMSRLEGMTLGGLKRNMILINILILLSRKSGLGQPKK